MTKVKEKKRKTEKLIECGRYKKKNSFQEFKYDENGGICTTVKMLT